MWVNADSETDHLTHKQPAKNLIMEKDEKIDKELSESIKQAFNAATTIFEERGMLFPALFFDFDWLKAGSLPEESTTIVVMLIGKIADARSYVMTALGGAFALSEAMGMSSAPKAVRMVIEAWISEPKDGVPPVRASDDPMKKEGVLVCGMNRDKQTLLEMREIVRILDGLEGNSGNVSVKIELRETDLTRLLGGKDRTMAAPLLDKFWEGYQSSRETLAKDAAFKEFISTAESDPAKFFTMVIETTLKNAQKAYDHKKR